MAFYGKEACSIDLAALVKPIARFAGVIEIIAGLALCFAGRKFVEYSVGFMVGAGTAGLIFMVSFNLGFMDSIKDGSIMIMIVVGAVSVLLGSIAGYCGYRFFKKWVVSIIGGIVAAVLLLILLSPWKTCPWIVKVLVVGVGICVGGYVGSKLDKLFKAVGTAIVGSFLLMHGLGSFAGGFPPIMAGGKHLKSMGVKGFGYIAGIIVFAIIGAVVQVKAYKEE